MIANTQTAEPASVTKPSDVALSSIDEERFGIRTARASCVTVDKVEAVLDFCHIEHVQLLIARCPVADLPTAQALEAEGAQLMDTLVYYTRHLTKTPVPSDTNDVVIRLAHPSDENQVREVARESFKGYFGHYHADPRLDRVKCDEAYMSWATRSCLSKNVADEVLIADIDGQVAGFATLRLNNADEAEGVLFGVAPFAQGRGIYKSFMIGGMNWCLSQSALHMTVSTQITNLAVQRVWTRLGFEMSRAYYTFHKWFK